MTQNPQGTITRRDTFAIAAAGAAAALIGAPAMAADNVTTPAVPAVPAAPAGALKGNINHSVCLWCYKMKVEEMIPQAKRIGLKGIDLLDPKAFPALKEAGLACSMTSGIWGGIPKGYNRTEHHEKLNQTMRELIDATAAAGFPNVICFSGNRDGMSDEEGVRNCAKGLKEVAAYAEQKKVTICMELLNSRRDHKDYMCDKSAWGIELCKAVGSERFKLLFDIYHMQIDEGDIIATIQKNNQFFGHYHTGGNPGRHEIDETQELYYPAIMKAIVATGFKGYVAQEFIPAKPDKIASLEAAVRLCDV